MNLDYDSISPITGNLCVLEEADEAGNTHYMCMESGYTTTSYLTIGSEVTEEFESKLTELMRTVRKADTERGLMWYPAFLQTPVAMLYCSGTDATDLIWEVAQVVPLTEEEQKEYPVPGYEDMYFSSRLDTENSTKFAQDKFGDALDLFYIILEKEYQNA
jgi:hypothetical protein